MCIGRINRAKQGTFGCKILDHLCMRWVQPALSPAHASTRTSCSQTHPPSETPVSKDFSKGWMQELYLKIRYTVMVF